jgi:F0F1-type ATP synthase assembly protein I
MIEYVVKVAVSAVLIVLISETSKRSTLLGALLASLPLVSVLAMLWLYSDTRDAAQVAALARSIFWLVLPSLLLFLLLPVLIERGYSFSVRPCS